MPAPPANDSATDAFGQTLEIALEHFSDATWLGENSPLASPFLQADVTSTDASARGMWVQALLRDAAAQLPAEQQALLNASFFQRNKLQNINGVAMMLNMSRAAYYRHRASALHTLADEVARRLNPTVHLEAVRPQRLFGREHDIRVIANALQAGQVVSISGPSGVGKTSLGQAIADAFGENGHTHTFWFTVRPPLNDQLESMVFALACFLQQHGAAQTWRQFLADVGTTTSEILLGLLRHDLVQLSKRVLVCIDEIDLLERDNSGHAAVLQLLEGLRSHAAMLLIGQRPRLVAQHSVSLMGLSLAETEALLQQLGLQNLPARTTQQIHAATQGNPLLLQLSAALYREGEPTALLLRQLVAAPTVQALLEKIWHRLNDDERAIWRSVAVCQQLAPRDAWADAELDPLVTRSLVNVRGAGHVYVLPPLRTFVLAQSADEELTAAHAFAATIFECRAQFTTAAYHFVQAGMPERAIWLWFNHRERETAHGRSMTAQTVFALVDMAMLRDEEARRALALLRAEWGKQHGRIDGGLAALDEVRWPHQHPHFSFAQRLRGNLLEMRGQLDQAAAAFREGLQASEPQRTSERVRLHTALGYAHFRQREMPQARTAALQAHLEVLDFRGMVEAESGNYVEAERSLREGLALAEQATRDNTRWIANLNDRLGRVLWQMGRVDEAVAHLHEAMRVYEHLGDTISPLYQRMNLSAAYIVAGKYKDALAEAAMALPLAREIGHAYLVAGLSLNAAEAHVYLNHLDEAERHALVCMQQEESAVQPYAFTVMGMIQRERGQYAISQNTLRTAVANAQAIEDRYAEANAWRELAQIYDCTGEAEEARIARDHAIALFDRLGLMHEAEKTRQRTWRGSQSA
jgi:tetratricopeptide (TPR) repeat protein